MSEQSGSYLITLWDKQVDEPYLLAYYEDEEEAKQVARNLKKHYIDDWGPLGELAYEVRLQKKRGDE
jgi:hypothetical protein